MRYAALAIDYDGTLATHGRVAPTTLQALEQLGASGRKLILVTGRELDELLGIFPEIGVFDRVVAENGALLYTPATRVRRSLAEAPPPAFVRELARRDVVPLMVGRTIVATVHPNETIVLEAIRDLGLELQVIFNKGAVMVLPASINKASGLKAALEELGLSLRNIAAIGDAENDHALLRAAEYGVAVANAVPMLQREADRISACENGAAVMELARDIVAHDLEATPPRVVRRTIALGTRADGTDVHLALGWTSLLVAGSSGSGKSSFVTGMLERLAAEGYQFCVFDPEGDYAELADGIVFGNGERGPGVAEVFTALEKPEASVVMNLIALPVADRPKFFHAMLPRLEAMRARTGRPHWIVIDEAHHLMPQELEHAASARFAAMSGTVLVTVHPESVEAAALRAVGAVVALGDSADGRLLQFGRITGVRHVAADAVVGPGEALFWSRDAGRRAEVIRAASSRAERRRHRRKYAEGALSPERCFHFRGPHRKLNLRAQNLVVFLQIADGVDDETWLHHLRRGDYSHWVRASIKDDALADELAAVERDGAVGVPDGRARIRAAVEARYTLPATGEGAG